MKFDGITAALIIIDIQNDFCPAYTACSGEKLPAGALAVADGDKVIEPLNRFAQVFADKGAAVIATADWHPPDHVSFASAHPEKKAGDIVDLPAVKGQVLWNPHCIQRTRGADFHDLLNLGPVHSILRKGFRRDLDSYSAFFENDRQTPTGLDGFLKGLGINAVFLGGLATDYCVYYSALDAISLGYKTIVLTDAVQGVGYPPGSVEKALDSMKSAGVNLKDSGDFL
ncbi:MAG: bifunctional nicotinamidase/pyrazinamidase [Treponema sp.]|jgi:nicotinamidase/pyrazinamidase|nr:bifunctional nicotinamidase/pyrazinamidase [Treponema sp.]